MGHIRQFMRRHYLHFNAKETRMAAEAYCDHLDRGGQMLVTLAGAFWDSFWVFFHRSLHSRWGFILISALWHSNSHSRCGFILISVLWHSKFAFSLCIPSDVCILCALSAYIIHILDEDPHRFLYFMRFVGIHHLHFRCVFPSDFLVLGALLAFRIRFFAAGSC